MILKIKHKVSLTIQAKFYICENNTEILGLKPSIQLGLVQINCSITTNDTRKIENIEDQTNDYPDRFQDIGNFPGKQKIYINENTMSVVQPQRKYPVHLKDELKKELPQMKNMGVIEKVNETQIGWMHLHATKRKVES